MQNTLYVWPQMLSLNDIVWWETPWNWSVLFQSYVLHVVLSNLWSVDYDTHHHLKDIVPNWKDIILFFGNISNRLEERNPNSFKNCSSQLPRRKHSSRMNTNSLPTHMCFSGHQVSAGDLHSKIQWTGLNRSSLMATRCN